MYVPLVPFMLCSRFTFINRITLTKKWTEELKGETTSWLFIASLIPCFLFFPWTQKCIPLVFVVLLSCLCSSSHETSLFFEQIANFSRQWPTPWLTFPKLIKSLLSLLFSRYLLLIRTQNNINMPVMFNDHERILPSFSCHFLPRDERLRTPRMRRSQDNREYEMRHHHHHLKELTVLRFLSLKRAVKSMLMSCFLFWREEVQLPCTSPSP